MELFPLNGTCPWTVNALEDAFRKRKEVRTHLVQIYSHIGVPRSFHRYDHEIEKKIDALHRTYDSSHQTPKVAFFAQLRICMESVLDPQIRDLIEKHPFESVMNTEIEGDLSDILHIRRMRYHYHAYLKCPDETHVPICVYEWLGEILDTANLANEHTQLLQAAKDKLIEVTSMPAQIAEITEASQTTFTPTGDLVEVAKHYDQSPTLDNLETLLQRLKPFLDRCQNIVLHAPCSDINKQWKAHGQKDHLKLFQIFLRCGEHDVVTESDYPKLTEAIEATYSAWHQVLTAICQEQQEIDLTPFMQNWWATALHSVDYLPLHLQLKDRFPCIPTASTATQNDKHFRIMRDLATHVITVTNRRLEGLSHRFHWDLIYCFVSHATLYLASERNLSLNVCDDYAERLTAAIFRQYGDKIATKHGSSKPPGDHMTNRQLGLCLQHLGKLILDYPHDRLSIQSAIATLFDIPIHDDLKQEAYSRLEKSPKQPDDIAAALRVTCKLTPPKYTAKDFPYTLTDILECDHPLTEEHNNVIAYLWMQSVMTPLNEPELSMQQLHCLPDMEEQWLCKLTIHCPESADNTYPHSFGEPFLHLLSCTFSHYVTLTPFKKIGFTDFDSILENYPHQFFMDTKKHPHFFDKLFKNLHQQLKILQTDDVSKSSAVHTIAQIYEQWLLCLQAQINKVPQKKILNKKRMQAIAAIEKKLVEFRTCTEKLVFVETINPCEETEITCDQTRIDQARAEGPMRHLSCLPIVIRLAQTTSPSMDLVAPDPEMQRELMPFTHFDPIILEKAYKSRNKKEARDLCEHYEQAIAIYPVAHPPLIRAWWRYCHIAFKTTIPLDLPPRPEKPDRTFFEQLHTYFNFSLGPEALEMRYEWPRWKQIVDNLRRITTTIHPFHVYDAQIAGHVRLLQTPPVLSQLHSRYPLTKIQEYTVENLIGIYNNPDCDAFAPVVDHLQALDARSALELQIAFVKDLFTHMGDPEFDANVNGRWTKEKKILQRRLQKL